MDREKIKNDLLNADFTDVKSETLSYIFAEMATKDDLRELRAEMQGEFAQVRSEMRAMELAIEKMGGELRLEIARSSADLHKEVAGVMKAVSSFQNKLFIMTLGLIGALATIFTALELFLR